MDEQIELIARALAEVAARNGTLCEGEAPEDNWEAWDEEARAAYSVMAGKVAEQVGTVNTAWLQWKAGEQTADEALTALFDQIVCPPLAALAPYPERRHE